MPQLSDAALAGIAMTPQGDLSDRQPADVYWQVVQEALADAGLGLADVDGLIGDAPPGIGIRSSMPGGAVADLVGHPLRFHASTSVGAASQSAGMGLAAFAIAYGLASVVVIPTVAAGRGAGPVGGDRDAAVAYMARLGTPYEYLWGTTWVADYAVVARRHMYEFGTTEEQLAEIAVAQRYGATLNPLSVNGRRGEITNLVDCEPGAVAIGMPVEMVFEDVTPDVTLYRFRPRV